MKKTARIAIVGDYDPQIISHQCLPRALEIASDRAEVPRATLTWMPTDEFANAPDEWKYGFDGYWCVPGSPFKSRAAVLEIIRFCRTRAVPYLGTCGGYQHAILEFALNELKIAGADLQEENPSAELPLVSALACRLNNDFRPIDLAAGSLLLETLGKEMITEEYNCGYGMNPRYAHLFDGSALRFVGFDPDRVPQAFELRGHPFFFGTAFQPERSARRKEDHPLITRFIATASGNNSHA